MPRLVSAKMHWRIAGFYAAALSCLGVAEIYFVTSYCDFPRCLTEVLQTYPAYAYLITGYTYIFVSINFAFIDRQLSESLAQRQKSDRRYKWFQLALYMVIILLTIAFIVQDWDQCQSDNVKQNAKFSGTFFALAYLLTFCLMCVLWSKQYRYLQKKFRNVKGTPLWALSVTTGIYAMSFSVRTTLNMVKIFDPSILQTL